MPAECENPWNQRQSFYPDEKTARARAWALQVYARSPDPGMSLQTGASDTLRAASRFETVKETLFMTAEQIRLDEAREKNTPGKSGAPT